MTTVVRGVIVAVLVCHGLIHLLGVAKGFGWAEVSALQEPVRTGAGVLWLLAAGFVLAAAVLLAQGAPSWWWIIAVGGAVVSELAIVSSWSDARAGTVVNVILVLAAGYALVSVGPASFDAQWRELATEALATVDPAPAVLTDADLADLPEPLAAYIRHSGAVGRPRVTSFHADVHGRIRSDPGSPWMPFTAQQISTYGPRPQRLFIMDATRSGLPVTVLHVYADAAATMRAKVLSLVTVVDAAGPEMDRGETVTVFNDLVVMAPGAIPDAPVHWTALDDRHVRGEYTDGDQTVSAVLVFDAQHDLVDFVSEDRLRASADGTSFTPQGWSTPIVGHVELDGRRLMTVGEGRWHAPRPQGTFTYIEFHLDAIAYNVPSTAERRAVVDRISWTAASRSDVPGQRVDLVQRG